MNTQRPTKGVIAILATAFLWGFTSQAAAQCDPTQLAKLFAFDGQSGDQYGNSVSISENFAIIGAPHDSDNGVDSGSAYLYERVDGEWLEIIKLLPGDGSADDLFGSSVSMDWPFIVIGAPSTFEAQAQGSAYVFIQFAGFWVEIEKFEANEGSIHDIFGFSVSISGERFIVGAPGLDDHGSNSGAAFIYDLVEFEWIQEGRVAPLDGQAGDEFGAAVSLSGDIAVIGSRRDDDTAEDAGSAYIYARLTGGDWIQRSKLLADDGAEQDWFGSFVASGGDTVVVGAPFDSPNGADSGSAYVYTSNDNGVSWNQNTKLVPDDGASADLFGSVAINGESILVGASGADTTVGINSGAAYLFTRAGGSWVQRSKILPTEANAGFGASPAIGNEYAVVGASQDGLGGAAYIFDLNCPASAADLTGDGDLNFFDVAAFLNAFAATDSVADFTSDGQWDFFDVSAFLVAFAAGSP